MRLVLLALLLTSLTACSLIENPFPDDLFTQDRVAHGQYVAARLVGTGVSGAGNVQVTVGGEAAEVVSFNRAVVVFEVPQLEPGEEEIEPPVKELEVVISDGKNEAKDSLEVAGEVFPDKAVVLLDPGESAETLRTTLAEAQRAFESTSEGIFGQLRGFEGFQIADIAGDELTGVYPVFKENPRPLFEVVGDALEVQGPCAGQLALLDFGGAPLAEVLAILKQVDPDLPIDGESATSGGQASVGYLVAINANPAFQTSFTGAGTTIAVLDTGVNEDAEYAGRLRADLGYDFVNDDTGTADDYTDPLTGTALHGTPIARLAAGGTSGVARGAEIMPVKVCDEDGECKASQIILGVCHALVNAPQGPQNLVLNLSFGGPVEVGILETLLEYAVSQNTLVAASMGNEGKAAQGVPHVPASFAVDGLVAVGALEDEEGWQVWAESEATGSSWGDHADLAAPGKGLLGSYTGTSFSTPLVVGTMALMREANAGASPAQVEGCLKSTAQPLGSPQAAIGEGMLDVAAALACIP